MDSRTNNLASATVKKQCNKVFLFYLLDKYHISDDNAYVCREKNWKADKIELNLRKKRDHAATSMCRCIPLAGHISVCMYKHWFQNVWQHNRLNELWFWAYLS